MQSKARDALKRVDGQAVGGPSGSRFFSQVGDRLTDETGEYEVIGRPYTTAAGKTAHVRVKRVGSSEVTMVRVWGAHERVAVTRTTTGGP